MGELYFYLWKENRGLTYLIKHLSITFFLSLNPFKLQLQQAEWFEGETVICLESLAFKIAWKMYYYHLFIYYYWLNASLLECNTTSWYGYRQTTFSNKTCKRVTSMHTALLTSPFLCALVSVHRRDTTGGDETDLCCSVPLSTMRTSITCFSPNITNRLL